MVALAYVIAGDPRFPVSLTGFHCGDLADGYLHRKQRHFRVPDLRILSIARRSLRWHRWLLPRRWPVFFRRSRPAFVFPSSLSVLFPSPSSLASKLLRRILTYWFSKMKILAIAATGVLPAVRRRSQAKKQPAISPVSPCSSSLATCLRRRVFDVPLRNTCLQRWQFDRTSFFSVGNLAGLGLGLVNICSV